MVGNKQRSKKSGKGVSPGEAVIARNKFYKDSLPMARVAAIISLVAVAINGVATIYVANKEPSVKYFAANENGSLIQLIPLDSPNLSDRSIKQWVVGALTETFTFGYTDWRQRLTKASDTYFTSSGREAIISELKSNGNLDAVIQKQLFSTLVVNDAPAIINKLERPGQVFAWEVQVPATITFRSTRGDVSERVIFQITIQRISQLQNPMGVGISQVIMAPDRK